ncbi:response regulator [Nitratireductor sp. GCM10026969]|uniref:response regulator n=1 Tax=Nitratireductor sp. GCM10026969 TaxID=3252645 RepID=UPI00360CEE0E
MTTKHTSGGGRNLILCVEDERDLREDIIEELRSSGHDAIGAGTGREALDALEAVRPDLILCDISMPEMNGYDLLRTMRKERTDLGDVPFVFLTALDERDEVISGKRAGVDDYLVKPIDFDLMLASIEARLAQTRRVRTLHRQDADAVQEAFRHLVDQERVTEGTTDVLNILGFGVVLTDAHGDVVFANAFARTLSAETEAFSLHSRLRAATPELSRELRTHVAEVADAASRGEDIMRGLALPRPDDGEELILVICALPGGRKDDAPSSLAAILISDSKRRSAPPEHMLVSLFGLTPTEAQIAHGLVSGQRSADIARRLKISQTTVAFHLRNLFEKTGTRRQVDLVALILSTPVAVR